MMCRLFCPIKTYRPAVRASMKLSAITITSLLFFLLVGGNVFAATWFVRSDIATPGDGTSWEESFSSIADAVAAAASTGDEIWVQAGTYSPAATIWVDKTITFLGGFDGSEAEASQRNFVTNETILDGGGAIRIMNISASATLDGFTLTNGSDWRSGALVLSGGSAPNIFNCKLTHNQSTRSDISSEGYNGGGAVWVSNASPTFNNCVFAHNSAEAFGGAVNAYSGSASFINCTFTRNTAYSGGAFTYSATQAPNTPCTTAFSGATREAIDLIWTSVIAPMRPKETIIAAQAITLVATRSTRIRSSSIRTTATTTSARVHPASIRGPMPSL